MEEAKVYDSPCEGGKYKIELGIADAVTAGGVETQVAVFAVYFREYGEETWESVKSFGLMADAVSFIKNEVEGDFREKCLTVGELRRALERLPDDCLVNTVEDSTVLGECVHVRHKKDSDYVDVGVIDNDRTKGE